MKWEIIDGNTERMKVSGGYLYKAIYVHHGANETGVGVSICFVPAVKENDL